MIGSDSDTPPDWLNDAWQALPERWQEVITRRLRGDTLQDIAADAELTRERVRQLQLKAEDALHRPNADTTPPAQRLVTELGDRMAVPDAEIAQLVPTSATAARFALLRRLGVTPPRMWPGELDGYWTRKPAQLDTRLSRLIALAPMSSGEAEAAAVALGIPTGLPIEQLLLRPGSKLSHHELGWIRNGRGARDLAYLWLREQGEPRPVSDIATVTGTSAKPCDATTTSLNSVPKEPGH